MTRSFPRVLAFVMLATVGSVVAISTFALVMARAVVAAGLAPVRAADIALLDDLVPLIPFIAAYGVANLVAALALVTGRPWADRLATAIATISASVGVVAFVLVGLGHDPFSSTSTVSAAADGLGIIGTFVVTNVVAIVALAFAGEPAADRTRPVRPTAASMA